MSNIILKPTNKGIMVLKRDTKYNRLRKCGRMFPKDGGYGYFSTHREILYKHNSLGISEDILRFLSAEGVNSVVKRVGFKDDYAYYESTVREYIEGGIRLEVRNEEEAMIHLPLREHTYLGETWGVLHGKGSVDVK